MPDTLTTIAELEALYGQPVEAATVKEVDRITPHYRAYIEASPLSLGDRSGEAGHARGQAALDDTLAPHANKFAASG